MALRIRISDHTLDGEQCHVMLRWSKDQRRHFDERVALLTEGQRCPQFKALQIAFWEVHDSAALFQFFAIRENPVDLKLAYDEMANELVDTENKLANITECLHTLQRHAYCFANQVERTQRHTDDPEYARLLKRLRRHLPQYMYIPGA